MTDKEIIINGVDVSHCAYYENEICMKGNIGLINNCFNKCSDYENCEQKQLQRKKQECIDLDNECQDKFNTILKLEDVIKELTQECEEFRKANDEKNEFLQKLGISATGEFHRINHYVDNLKTEYKEYKNLAAKYLADFFEVQKECEELKEKFYQIEDIVTLLNEDLPEDNVIRLIMLILNNCKGLKPSRYKQALEKIEELVKTGVSSSLCNCGLRAMSEDVLQIINEVKNND